MKSIVTKARRFCLLTGLFIASSVFGQTPQTGAPVEPSQNGGVQTVPTPTVQPLQPLAPSVTQPVFSARPRVELVDEILVVVDNDVITRHDLDARIDYTVRQLRGQGVALPPVEAMERQLLDRMILERVQVQRAKELDLKVTDEQLNQIIRRIIDGQRPGASVDEFRASLEASGIDYNYFREDLRKEVLISVVREQEIDSKVQVTNEEVENYLINQRAESDLELNVDHIVVSTPLNASSDLIAEKQAVVETVMRSLSQGADFGQLAMQYSEAQDAMEGGKLGWRAASSLPTLYVDALGDAKEGEVVGPLKSAAGIHIVRLNGRRTVDEAGEQVEQHHARHILIRVDEGNSSAVVVDRLQQLRRMLLENPDRFPELAKQYSQDASNTRGGDLGWVSPGDMVPDFERAMVDLSVGEISEPVQSPFGWHLIQVTEKRVGDMTDSRRRAAARKALRERKINDTYEQWLVELRDEAFIDIKDRDDD